MTDGREAALDQYVAAYDRFLQRKVDLMREGTGEAKVKAAGAEQYARWLERGIEDEISDKTPPPPCACAFCQEFIVQIRLAKLDQ